MLLCESVGVKFSFCFEAFKYMYDFKVLFLYCVYICVYIYNNNESIFPRNSVAPVEALRVGRTTFIVRSNVTKNSYHNYVKL